METSETTTNQTATPDCGLEGYKKLLVGRVLYSHSKTESCYIISSVEFVQKFEGDNYYRVNYYNFIKNTFIKNVEPAYRLNTLIEAWSTITPKKDWIYFLDLL